MLNQHIQLIGFRTVPEDKTTKVNWDMLVEQSPELETIRLDAARSLTGKRDNAFWNRYEGLKRRLRSNVGWYAHPDLPGFVHSPQAYDLAFQTIFGGLV